MVKKSLLLAVACTVSFTVHADQSIIDEICTESLQTKESILGTIQTLEPRELQMLANTFYWSHKAKKAAVIAALTAKRNLLLANNILLKTYSLEYAHDERVVLFFKELHETWQTAHNMQNAQNACVGILTFKQEINDIANSILMRMCRGAMNLLTEKKDVIFERAHTLQGSESQEAEKASQLLLALDDFYLAPQTVDAMSPALHTIKQQLHHLIHKHFAATHTLHDIHTYILGVMDEFFAQEFLAWYRVIYTTMQERDLIDTPYGTIMCDHTGLIEEENRTELPHPDSLEPKA